jgi:DNA-binding transcriptional LysR family regulator
MTKFAFLGLGVTEVIAFTWLDDFLRAFRHTYPSAKVALEVDISRDIDHSLAAGHIDLAFQTAPFSDDTNVKHAITRNGYSWLATPQIVHEIGQMPDKKQVFARSVLSDVRHTSAGRARGIFLKRRLSQSADCAFQNFGFLLANSGGWDGRCYVARGLGPRCAFRG